MSFLFPASTITFEAALRDLARGSPKARAQAARALGGVDDPEERRRALDPLVRALDDDKAEVRDAAAAALGTLESVDDAVVRGLVKRLGDGDMAVRQHAAIALGTLRAEAGFAALADALTGGPPDLRFQAATSLAEIDPAGAFDHVLAALGDGDAHVVGAAALSVGAIAANDEALAPRAVEALATAHGAADSGARFDIAYALAELDDPRGTAALADAVTDPVRSWDAVTALGWLRAETELLAALGHKRTPDEARTLAAGRLLAIGPSPRAQKALVDALAHRKIHVRGIAVEQLTEVGGAWARVPLDKLVRTAKGSELREPIEAALRAIAEREKA